MKRKKSSKKKKLSKKKMSIIFKKKEEKLGKGRYKTVYLSRYNNTYVAKCVDSLDCTNDSKLKYIIKCIDENTYITELGVMIDYHNDDDIYIRYMSQITYSCFELTYMNIGTPDGIQSVVSKNDNYRFKRIDFTWSKLYEHDVYNQLQLLLFNLSMCNFKKSKFKSKYNYLKKRILCDLEIINTVHNFFNFLCEYYNINPNKIIPDNSLYISKDNYIKNSMFYLEPYIKFMGTFYNRSELEEKRNEIKESLELDWYKFDYIFNTLRPIYGGIMNYLEINIFDKDKIFKNIVDKEYKRIINTVEVIIF